ncbi:hypothetical protein [Sphingobium sp. Z007]|uniref:hypothetical protein n=1 Tax=Sphingobium sp. Z007 TaxID=627495 RepID=UPI001124D7EF|nr:hypothetical protein [Sphingobium sp. Z007]
MAGYSDAHVVRFNRYRVIAASTFRVLRWSVALPLVGLVILNIMLPLMLFPTLFAPWLMIKSSMKAGFVPSLITVVVHFFLARRTPRFWMIPITVCVSTVTAWLWWGLVFEFEPSRAKALRDPSWIVLGIAALASLPLAIWARPTGRSIV